MTDDKFETTALVAIWLNGCWMRRAQSAIRHLSFVIST